MRLLVCQLAPDKLLRGKKNANAEFYSQAHGSILHRRYVRVDLERARHDLGGLHGVSKVNLGSDQLAGLVILYGVSKAQDAMMNSQSSPRMNIRRSPD